MYRNSVRTLLFPLLLAAGVIGGILFGRFVGRNGGSEIRLSTPLTAPAPPEDKLSYTLALIDREYVDSVSVDSLVERVIPMLVGELDPHSVYIPASEMQAVNEPLEGEFDGIGVVFNMATDTATVINVIPSGPSHRAGVQAGDRIVRIDDSLVAGRRIPQQQIVHMLRGPRGSHVKLTLRRYGIADSVEVVVERGVIPIRSIEASFMLTDDIGFVRLGQFARTSHAELIQALVRLRAEGMKRLVFDLRGNAGGYLDQAIRIANEFLHAGQLIVYTEDRYGRRMSEYADGSGSARDLEVAVLIDEGSASSSEILAGALQDNDRGTIVGRRSFGKGLVQRQIPYADGSALRLTTARYYTPTGRSIQKPYTNGDEESYAADLFHRYENNEFFTADSIHFADSLRFVTPGGKTVYGGGGIMPDLFVPADTTEMSPWYFEVMGRNILYRFTMEYADRHRDELNRVASLPALQRLLDNDRTLFDDFVRYAGEQGVRPNYRDIDRSYRLVEAQLRAFIGRNTMLEENAFYANIYPEDRTMQRAVESFGAAAADSLRTGRSTDADSRAEVSAVADTVTERRSGDPGADGSAPAAAGKEVRCD